MKLSTIFKDIKRFKKIPTFLLTFGKTEINFRKLLIICSRDSQASYDNRIDDRTDYLLAWTRTLDILV